jgi:uncharacterized Fe-S cluster protein YjdI
MSQSEKKEYTNGEITIVWEPGKCIHSTKCWKGHDGLLDVFNPKERPWIKPNGASTERIMQQIDKCPSGALSYYKNTPTSETLSVVNENIVEVMKNGPLLVYGNLQVKDAEGNVMQKNKVTAFCRCGASSNKPYCDGTHTKIKFEG